uniref:Uncharacterized protein n=1 Tax=Amphimedon queenslandica TaxID=400682 RepID=A0A1X7VME9_AMPQE
MVLDLHSIVDIGTKTYDDLVFRLYNYPANDDEAKVLVCTQKELRYHPRAGLLSKIKITLNVTGDYDLQVVMMSKEKGNIRSCDEFLSICGKISKIRGCKSCPGFDTKEYDAQYFQVIRYDPKSVRRIAYPIIRIDLVLKTTFCGIS